MRLGEVVDRRFKIDRLAGSGGMGTVYRAMDRVTGAHVALKLLGNPDPTAVNRFEHEARILAELHHPRIVRHVAHGVTPEGEPYLAMEWLDGESLSERLTRGPIPIEESVALTRAAAEALGAAHARNVVHRDIKPSNLFLVENDIGGLKVLDFGIARMSRTFGTFTQTGSVMGTPGYMAPEQARGERVYLDARADVFSLGAVLFECLTGRPAFEGQHIMALLAKLLMEEAPRVREISPQLPSELDDLVARMLAKDPEDRPKDGAAVAEALDSIGAISGRVISIRSEFVEAITTSEMRLLSVVAATKPGRVPEARSQSVIDTLSREVLTRLHTAVQPLGARMDELADGTLLLSLSGAGHAIDQAVRAAQCALRLRDVVPEFTVVLATGRAEQTGRLPVGPVMERAATLLMASAGEPATAEKLRAVRVDDVTRSLLDAWFEIESSERGMFLLREREVGRHARTLLGKPSPCVGRDRELRNLRELLDECFDDRAALAILISGPPGIGKTRLCHELLTELHERRPDVAISIGRGDAMSAGSPFSLLGSAIRGAAGITGGEPVDLQREKLLCLVGRVRAEDRKRVAACLGELAGTPVLLPKDTTLVAPRAGKPGSSDHLPAAYLDFITAECAARPCLLVLEDLQWGDAASIKLIDRALRDLRDMPFAVLSLTRFEVRETFPKLWEGREVQEIKLGALPRRAAEEIVRRMLGDSIRDHEVTQLVERAGGNVFYLEELIRAVAEGRGDSLPETVLGMVEARIEALPPEARRVLRAASVFGETFWKKGVFALLGDSEGTTVAVDWLPWLLERELIVRRERSRFKDQDEYAFRHALIRDGSYAKLPERDRALGHNLAAEWLLQAGEYDPKVLAQHFDQGGETLLAAEFYQRATEQALTRGDYGAAIALAQRGLDLGASPEADAMFRELQAEADRRDQAAASDPSGSAGLQR